MPEVKATSPGSSQASSYEAQWSSGSTSSNLVVSSPASTGRPRLPHPTSHEPGSTGTPCRPSKGNEPPTPNLSSEGVPSGVTIPYSSNPSVPSNTTCSPSDCVRTTAVSARATTALQSTCMTSGAADGEDSACTPKKKLLWPCSPPVSAHVAFTSST